MIKRFKPYDFQECLIGLPISNWLLVDEENFESSTLGTMVRPKMLISHIEELKGISVSQTIDIRCYTHLEEVLEHKMIPNYFKNILSQSANAALEPKKTLGGYLNSDRFKRLALVMFAGSNITLKLESYHKSRVINFRTHYEQSSQLKEQSELYFEVNIPKMNIEKFVCNQFSYKMPDNIFSYFMGIDKSEITLAVMLPNNRIIYCEQMKALIEREKFKLNDDLQHGLFQIFRKVALSINDDIQQTNDYKEIFEQLIWLPLNELLKG